ncbi:MAG: riboflavin synthase, partial [Spirochaetes bacterium]|nr:riboflavin synthase [Spirochaetota bacterium]
MFTGIIETIGKIARKNVTSKNIVISIQPALEGFLNDIHKGSSIAVNGACLTVSEFSPKEFTSFIATETYNITNLKSINFNDKVNLEKALKLGERLDGHFVTGHIDDTAIVTGIHKINQDYSLSVKIKPALLKYIIIKGSIAINGISLTIAKITS